jgi:hypothetical protein
MNEKQKILALLLPKAVLKPVNGIADRAVPDGMIQSGYIAIRDFPFRVGRESRGATVEGKFFGTLRPRAPGQNPNNDLYLMDPGPGMQVSREHFQIERRDSGYVLVDRGSTLGTIVGDVRLGRNTGLVSTPLADGDTIRIGEPQSPYLYTFICDLVPGN